MSLFDKLVFVFMPIVPKPIVKFFSKNYIAGATVSDAVTVTKELNRKGIKATIDVLGESTFDRNEALESVQEYLNLLDTIQTEKLKCGISLKPTQLGILIDSEFCFNNIHSIIAHAKKYDIFVRVDMEDSNVTDKTIELFLKLHHEFDNVGIVIQAYLRKSLKDVNRLSDVKTNFRLCKGIYREPWNVAYQDHDLVNKNFALLIERALEKQSFVGIATHDETIIWESLRIIDNLNLNTEQYEFQMLLGVTEELRQMLVDAGHNLRVYVPFGKQWYAYSVRRLKENPTIALYVIQSIFKSIWRKK